MKTRILFTLLVLNLLTNAQNYLYNNGFEAPISIGVWPTGVAQTSKMTDWLARTYSNGGYDLHSPDWINTNGTGNQSINSANVQIHQGQGMIGMTNYELIQQKISGHNIPQNTYITFSAWVYMPSNVASKNSSLRIVLSTNHLTYEEESNAGNICSQNYISYDNTSIDIIHEFDFNSLGLPYDSWQKISYSFKSPNSSYDYFAMELRKNGYNPGTTFSTTGCEDSYLLIDDVSLVESSFCKAACAPNLGAITHGTFQNFMFSDQAFGFTVKNAIGIEFRLYDRWGLVQTATEDAFDPNGLIDVGYADYAFGWNALNSAGNLFPEDTYPYFLKIWNCTETINYSGSLYIYNSGPAATLGWNIHNFDLNDCCPNDRYIQNTTYVGNYIETAKNNIYAGNSVTNTQTFGDVIINSGVTVKYVAKNIHIQNGFTVNPGGKYIAIPTEDCVYQPVQRLRKRERPPLNDDSKLIKTKDLVIYPNPSDGIYTVKALNSEILSIEVYNYYGAKIISYNKDNFNSLINIQNQANGTYFYKIVLIDGDVSSGKLVKIN